VLQAGLVVKMAERLYNFPPPAILALMITLSISEVEYKYYAGRKQTLYFTMDVKRLRFPFEDIEELWYKKPSTKILI
jgi:hypothetical protein